MKKRLVDIKLRHIIYVGLYFELIVTKQAHAQHLTDKTFLSRRALIDKA